jgi:rhodanese-related sulfurtransferase
MTNFTRLPLLTLALAWLLPLVACTKSPVTQVPAVAPREAAGLLANDFAVLVDVREEDEVKATGLAEKARWIPMSKIEADAPEWKELLASTPKDKQVLFYCAVGGRAGKAAARMAQAGHQVGNVGGFEDWKSAGLPVRPQP